MCSVYLCKQYEHIPHTSELEMLFVKHNAPNHMIGPILHIQPKALHKKELKKRIEHCKFNTHKINRERKN